MISSNTFDPAFWKSLSEPFRDYWIVMDAILAPFIATSAETCTQKSVPALYAQGISSYGRRDFP